ncbi:MAG TPA: galactose-1-phosphate uridylyltransferase [Mycobacteriales bacterium]|nr:galactose-1-phosphate uridylyltransferase [Mycobacteriales bacterium]
MAAYKTETRLADGRALYYFDSRSVVRDAPDKRDLPPTTTASEIRWDPLLDQWVVIASHRQTRTFLPPPDECPLDPSRDGRLTEIPAEDYEVVAFENRFPSLSTSAVLGPDPDLLADDDPLFTRRAGLGRCEVVCFTSDHSASFSSLSPERAGTVFDAWVDRTEALNALPEVEQVFVFENRGEEIGVTLSHPHGQIYAYPFVPPRMRRQLDSSRRYRERTGECLHCTLLAAEREAAVRIVAETDLFTVVVPHAARWPYEAHVYARRHVPDLPALTGEERAELAEVYLDLLRRFDSLFPTPTPYIAAWMQAPARHDRDLAHLHAQVFSIRRAAGKLKYLAGSESGAGVWVNDISPERAAAALRAEPV